MKIFIVLLLCSLRLYAYDFEISIAAMFKDEGRFLKEWIEFHRLIGVQHFYLYNDHSKDNFREVLQPYIAEGVVELFDCQNPSTSKMEYRKTQMNVLLDAARRARGVSKWMAFIDIDEFIFPVEEKNLSKFLSRFEKYGTVTANWQLFGTSHVKSLRDDQLMIEQLVFRAERNYLMNQIVKSIVKVDSIDLAPKMIRGPHVLKLMDGASIVNANEIPLIDTHFDPTFPIDKIRIHHYCTRDEDFLYNVKLKRPNADASKTKVILEDASASNAVEDRSILIYAEELRKVVFSENKSSLSD